jgi:hypothetical protein
MKENKHRVSIHERIKDDYLSNRSWKRFLGRYQTAERDETAKHDAVKQSVARHKMVAE